MMRQRPNGLELTDADLEFVVGEAAPAEPNKERLKQLVREDESFQEALVGDERVFQRVMSDEEVFVKISPALFFEVLLRKALKGLQLATHTVERTGRQSIPVFDTREVVEILARPEVLKYLAGMLASFTRIQSYVLPVRVRRGIRRRVRYNDMDIDSLIRFCSTVDEEQRFGYYKRIADVCLFTSVMFPDYVLFDYRYPASGDARPVAMGRVRRSLGDYEWEGRRFYGLAEEHPTARVVDLSEVFGTLRQNFTSARKPLSFIATHYLHSRRHLLFGAREQ